MYLARLVSLEVSVDITLSLYTHYYFSKVYGFEPISYRGVLLGTLLHAIVHAFIRLLHSLLNVLVQIANKMGLQINK
jgi:small-conductance mechanosensitive channel